MHAIQVSAYGGSSVLHWGELPEPVPGPGQVSIRVVATGVNFADIMSRRGGYSAGSQPPFVPGLDCLGTILAVGPGVTAFEPGQRVAAFPEGGSYAECVVAKSVLTYAAPAAVADDAAASLNVLVTACNILRLAGRLAAGESVLIHAAAGGVGSTAVQMARALGAGRIFATVGGPAKFEVARNAGADVVIDYHSENFAERILAETAGAGVDVILDSVAGDVFTQGFAVLAPFGRYVIFGQASGKPATVAATQLHRENRAVIGYTSGGYRKRRPEALRPAVEAAFEWVASGAVKVFVGARFPLCDAAKAQDFVESRKSTGKVLLTA